MISISPVSNAQVSEAEDSSLPHVLLVVDQFPKTLGGGERIVLRLAAQLPAYGYRVSILTFFVHPECDALTSSPCPVYLLPLRRTYDLDAFRAALQLRRFLKSHRVQIVQTFFESSDLWAGLVTKLASGAKLIWSRRDMGILRGSKHKIAYRLASGAPDAVFAVSEQVRTHCIEVDHIDPRRVYTIYNGLDLAGGNSAAGLRRAAAGARVVTVGNIRRVKGHDVFIQAAATVLSRFPETSFSIAGEVLEPDYFDELQALIRDLKLGDRFHFAGGVADTSKYLSEADIFVLPSRSEGFSNAIIEAMAASLPVVATNVGGNAEAVIDGATGFVVPPEEPGALADAIVDLLADPPRAKAMGDAGRTRVEETFTIRAMMQHIVDVYRKLLA